LAKFYALLVVIAAAGAALLLISLNRAAALPPSDVPVQAAVRPLKAPTGRTAGGFFYKGDPKAPLTVVEYADFQCPSCAAFFRQGESSIDHRFVETGKVQLVFHEFPLPQHANAVPAAATARCAGEQNAFWPMHDLLFSRQREWDADANVSQRFAGYAQELALNRADFAQCLNGATYVDVLNKAVEDGNRNNIHATPTFVVDGKQVDASALQTAIEAALNAKGK
jgi:protein-disulfide isomerase